jgi:hypothetical protein
LRKTIIKIRMKRLYRGNGEKEFILGMVFILDLGSF